MDRLEPPVSELKEEAGEREGEEGKEGEGEGRRGKREREEGKKEGEAEEKRERDRERESVGRKVRFGGNYCQGLYKCLGGEWGRIGEVFACMEHNVALTFS